MPLALLSGHISDIAKNWDDTAEICALHGDMTGAAAFRTCANQLRRAVNLPERDIWAPEQTRENTNENATTPQAGAEP